jgi:hypothetical protein
MPTGEEWSIMSEQPPAEPSPGDKVQSNLREVAKVLRSARHLGPEAQTALADLVDELGQTVNPAALSAEAAEHLADSASHLAEGLEGRRNETLLAAARHRLEEVALRAETEAPTLAGIVRRLLDALADLGI